MTNAKAAQEKSTKVQTLTVQDLAKAWLLDGVARKDGNAELQRRFNILFLAGVSKGWMPGAAGFVPQWTLSRGPSSVRGEIGVRR